MVDDPFGVSDKPEGVKYVHLQENAASGGIRSTRIDFAHEEGILPKRPILCQAQDHRAGNSS